MLFEQIYVNLRTIVSIAITKGKIAAARNFFS